ncbi:hypothetical protein KFU94_49155 [Chloroflexi bacterium TSY]|nr:hypothetical protein [Chloroflexi bacterium TSY]
MSFRDDPEFRAGLSIVIALFVIVVVLTFDTLSMSILVDRTTFEIFAHEGRAVLPLGIVLVDDNYALAVAAKGGRARIVSLDIWQPDSIWDSLRQDQNLH